VCRRPAAPCRPGNYLTVFPTPYGMGASLFPPPRARCFALLMAGSPLVKRNQQRGPALGIQPDVSPCTDLEGSGRGISGVGSAMWLSIEMPPTDASSKDRSFCLRGTRHSKGEYIKVPTV